MWKHVSGGAVCPEKIDETGSKRYVRVRKNITLVEATGEDDAAHYEWDEMAIDFKTWAAARIALENSEALRDVYGALTEVVDMVIGGEG